jgi:hypothetical protein
MAALLKQLFVFEDKYEEEQPEFAAAWARDYGTQSGKVWFVQPVSSTTYTESIHFCHHVQHNSISP